jgi:hypothetical protein
MSFVIVLLGTVLAAPGTVFAQAPGEATREPPRIRFLHGAQTGATDFYVAGVLAAPGLEFGDVSDYYDVSAGRQSLEAVGSEHVLDEGRNSRADPDSPTGYAEFTAKLKPGSATTVVLTADEGGSNELRVTRTKADPKAGKSMVRIVSLCPDCGPVDFAVDEATKLLVENIADVKSDYVRVRPGELDLEMRPTGQKKPLADFDPVTVVPHSYATLYAVGSDLDDTITLVPVIDEALTKVRVANSSLGGPDVDVYIGGWKAAQGLRQRRASPFTGLLSGDYRVQVVESGEAPSDGTLSEGVITLEPGATSAIVVGEADSIYVAPVPNDPKKAAKVSRIRFAAISPDLPTLDVWAGDGLVAEGLDFGEWSGYVGKGDGDIEIRLPVLETGAASTIGSMKFMEPMTSYSAYIAGSPEDDDVAMIVLKDRVSKRKK